MFRLFKRDRAADAEPPRGVLRSLQQGLHRTRDGLAASLSKLLPGGRALDAATLEELEDCLLLADVGVEASGELIEKLRARHKRQRIADVPALTQALRAEMIALLQPVAVPLLIPEGQRGPFIVLVVGVNGAGKTTTIGKLALQARQAGYSAMLAAGDTFRAAAVEQLQTWGQRLDTPVIAQASGADAASVIYDAVAAAHARNIQVLIADTAGRLHTRDNLMEELKKIKRVITKLDSAAPHETLIVLDATTGQNALMQAQEFHAAIGITGIALTKMDGTAKGGILFAIAQRLRIPIRYLGIGEQADDLRVFNAEEFVDSILGIGAAH